MSTLPTLPKIPGTDPERCVLDVFRTAAAVHLSKHLEIPVETAFSEELIAYWLSFVRTLDPNTHKLARSPVWPESVSGKRAVLQEDLRNSTTRSGVFLENEPQGDRERCKFVAGKVEGTQD